MKLFGCEMHLLRERLQQSTLCHLALVSILCVTCFISGEVRAAVASSAAPASAAEAAISTISDRDWSILDADVLVARVLANTSVPELLVLARKGDAKAECVIGIALAYGLGGVPRDPTAAADWLRKSADLGFPGAQVMLGFLYQEGEGVDRDDAAASKLYEQAADQGDAGAQLLLAMMILEGRAGSNKDSDRALQLLEASAAQGNPPAVQALAELKARAAQTAK